MIVRRRRPKCLLMPWYAWGLRALVLSSLKLTGGKTDFISQVRIALAKISLRFGVQEDIVLVSDSEVIACVGNSKVLNAFRALRGTSGFLWAWLARF